MPNLDFRVCIENTEGTLVMYNQSHNLSGVLERSGVGVRSTLDHVLYILYMFDPTIRHVRIRHTWRMLAGMFFFGHGKGLSP